ncbi:MAG: ABC transporter permease [Candidatus Saccharimonadales bacterium]
MFVTDVIRRSARSLKSAKIRTLLTALAISIGAFTLTLTLAASNGLRGYTDRLIASNFDPAELLIGRDPEVSNTGAPNTAPREFDESVGSIQTGSEGGMQLKQVTDSDVAALRQKPFIEQVRENFQISIRYVTREGQKRYTGSVEAYNPSQKPELRAGSLPASGDIPKGTILLPEEYIELLGFKDAAEAVGAAINVNAQQPFGSLDLGTLFAQIQAGATPEQLAGQSQAAGNQDFAYKITAVTKKSALALIPGSMPLAVGSADARVLYDFTTKGTANHGKYIYVSARIKDGENQQNIKAAQAELKDEGFYTISSEEIQKTVTQFVDVLTIMVGVFGFITIIASVFGVINTMYISVLQRTREVGLMKALGMRRRDIGRLFRLEAALIGFLGGLIGSVIAVLAGTVLNPWLTKQLSLGEGEKLLQFQPLQIIVLIVLLVLVAIAAGWLPSRKAAKLDPIEALRTE